MIIEVARYFKPTSPTTVTNGELYEMAENITIGELEAAGLEYLGKTPAGSSIRLGRNYGKDSIILIRDCEDLPLIAVVESRDISKDVRALSGLLKMDLEEVTSR